MAFELEFFTMRGHRRHDGFRRCLAARERRGSQNAAHDHARLHVPWLRLQTDLDRDAIFARTSEQVIELAERSHGKWAGRFKEDLEHARPVAPDKRISAPLKLCHTMLPFRSVRCTAGVLKGTPSVGMKEPSRGGCRG
jgi:hypothetical protein